MRVISVSSSCDGDNRKDMNVKQTSSPSTTMGNSNVAFSINASDQKDEAEEETDNFFVSNVCNNEIIECKV